VSAGGFHTCGVTTSDLAYCWGRNSEGQLGDGTTTGRRLTPVAVAGGLRFRQVSADGFGYTCGVTTDNQAFCWGNNFYGQLGDGTTTTRLTPVAVAGGLRFRQVSAGAAHTCGVTTDDRAYCWGFNQVGQLGDGTTINRLTPVAVAGGLRFRQLSPDGSAHTCGVTTDDRAYCWGRNAAVGALGDGTTTDRLTPVAVAGGLSFRQVSAGGFHTCGVTTTNLAYCWGYNADGQLGDSTTTRHLRPVRVAGGHRFLQVNAAGSYTCAVNPFNVNPFNRAFCWGNNFYGQLGDGTTTTRLTPVRVVGGLPFRQVSAGGVHTCGVTTSDLAYCWGYNNFFGALGDGTLINRRRPTPVAGAM
jgi:alpha-tubulin suppressor-like RCC1 family protein